MTVQSNLSTAINAYIQSTFLGTLTEISASKINLTSLLEIQQTLADPSGAQTVVLAVFRATAPGPGYSLNDIIVFRQTAPAAPEYLNATTGAIIATPSATNLGSISTASNVNANITSSIPLQLADTQSDIHGQMLGVSRITQVTAKFFQQSPSNFLNISASGGAAAIGPTLGLGIFSTGTAATASLLAQTPTTIMYSTAYEAWASQAAIFTTPTSPSSFQRLGIYDAVNGYFFGFNGLTFGLTIRSNSADTFVPKTSWNTDTLVGAAGSKFTSNGVPVALVPTNINMYRVRYGWYGAVTVRLEIYSPDGDWVLVHNVRTANTLATANITNPDLPMTLEVSKTASNATDLRILCGGWAAGITAPASGALISGQGAIAALNAFVAVPVTGLGALAYAVTGAWVGTLIFQYSLDGLNWYTDSPLNTATGAFLPSTTVNGSFTASIGSYKFYRIIPSAWTSGSASIVYNGSPSSNFMVAQLPQLPSSLGAKAGVNSVSFVPATDAIFTVSQAPIVPAFLFTSTITRVNNVLAYAANTVYGGALQLISSVAPLTNQWIIITDVEVIFNLAVLPAGMAGFQLYTYGVTPPSNVLDTGAFSLPAGDRASIIYPNGLSLGNAALARGGGSVTVQANNINVAVQLNGTSLFAYLVSIGAFTPAAALETATIRVRAIAL